jgi:hypothetical protein
MVASTPTVTSSLSGPVTPSNVAALGLHGRHLNEVTVSTVAELTAAVGNSAPSLKRDVNHARWPCMGLRGRTRVESRGLFHCTLLRVDKLALSNLTCSMVYVVKEFTLMTRWGAQYMPCLPGNHTHCSGSSIIHGCNGKEVENEECPGNRSPEDEAVACDYAVSVIASGEYSRRELYLFLLTFARFEPKRALYLLADDPIRRWVASGPAGLEAMRPPRHILFPKLCPGSPVCDGLDPVALKAATREHILFQKMVPMEIALRDGHRGVLALDSDVILFAPLPAMGPEELGLMPCNCHFKRIEMSFGRYSSGMVFTRRLEVLQAWEKGYKRSRYFEQAALDTLNADFRFFLLGPSHNVNFQQTEFEMARYADQKHGAPFTRSEMYKVGKFALHYPSEEALKAQANSTVLWQVWPHASIVRLRSLHVHLITNRSWWWNFINLSFYILHRSEVRDDMCLAYPEFCTEERRALMQNTNAQVVKLRTGEHISTLFPKVVHHNPGQGYSQIYGKRSLTISGLYR